MHGANYIRTQDSAIERRKEVGNVYVNTKGIYSKTTINQTLNGE